MSLNLEALMNIFEEDEALALLHCMESDVFDEECKKQNVKATSFLIEGCLLRSFFLSQQRRTISVFKEVEEKDDNDFFKDCRIGRETFYKLVERLSADKFYVRYHAGGRPQMGAEVSLLMALWYLQQRRYTEIQQEFEVSISSSHRHINFVIDFLTDMAPEVIVWPKAQEVVKIVEEFNSIASFPGVIGVIGSWRIKIRAPAENIKAYIDEEGNYSVNVIVVCDSRKKLTYTNIGFEGSAQNQRVFANSELGKRLEDDAESCCFNPNYHLIGDNSFALKEYLLVPFREQSNLETKKREFNRRLQETRQVVEETFEWMKIRFDKMNHIEADIQRVPKIITAMCVLHNLSMNSQLEKLLLAEDVEKFRQMQALEIEESGSHMKCVPFENFSESVAGIHKRNFVLKSIHN
ncbi:UNVERIFIED_CONTAM: hypothetical protein RMT77_016022 [Armadillidium vulgare]